MSDIVDIATNEISLDLENKLARLRRRVRAIKQSAPLCAECGEPIPLERQQAIPGCRLCVDCQEEKEKAKNASSL